MSMCCMIYLLILQEIISRRPETKCQGKVKNGGGNKSFCVIKGGKHHNFIWRGSYGVSWKFIRRSQVE